MLNDFGWNAKFQTMPKISQRSSKIYKEFSGEHIRPYNVQNVSLSLYFRRDKT